MGWRSWWRRDLGGEGTRWLMVDVETSGLDAAHDRLLAIAAVALRVDWRSRRLAVVLGDSFEVLVRQDVPSARENILVHGIGVQRQAAGVPLPMAMDAFAAFAGDAPLLAFHAAFDRTMIDRHARAAFGAPLRNAWLDVDHLCAVTYPDVPARSLDEWMAQFDIHCASRHVAIADALAECELLLRIWPRVAHQCASWRAMERLAAQHRWIARR
jgi:DNA polymerase III subunit epsilon